MNPTRRLLLAVSAAALAGRGTFAVQAPKPSAPVLGAIAPLSGSLSLTGNEALRGIQLAADAVNATGGIAGAPVNLATADSMDQSAAAAAANTLIANHAATLLGANPSALCYPASAAAELAQIPYIELIAPADGITARGFKFLLRTGPTTTMMGTLAATTIAQRFTTQKIGLLFNTGATGGAIAKATIAALNTANIPITLAIGYPEDTTDLAPPTGRLMRAGVTLVLHAAGPADALAFALAQQNLGWQPATTIGCGDGYALRETAAALGPMLAQTLVIAAPYYPPAAAPIAAAYTARFGTQPRSPDSLTAYTGAKLVLDTLAALNGDTSKLLDTIRKTNIPENTLPNTFGASFDHTGQNTRSLVTLQQWHQSQLIPA